MARNGYGYGYRVDIQDPQSVTAGFGEAVVAYLKSEGITPSFLYDYFAQCSSIVHLKNIARLWLGRPAKTTFEYSRWGYYNNFHITNLAFWEREDVQSFLQYMDRIGAAYKYRWSDLPVQSVSVQMFLPKKKVHKFTDWTYQHASVSQFRIFYGFIYYGGIYEGTRDCNSEIVSDFKRRYGRLHCKRSY